MFLLPIEPLEERYTSAWWRWLPESFGSAFRIVNVLGGALTTTVETGAFLDLHSRVHWCAVQLQSMAIAFKRCDVRDGDAIFVADLEHWGVEALRYMARLSDVDVRIFGFLHAASYTKGDFMEPMSDVGQYAERAWIAACDLVFVGTGYAKASVIERRLSQDLHLHERIRITGNPWRTAEARALVPNPKPERVIDVLFPHRPDAEKRPRAFVQLLLRYADEHGGMPRVAFTTGRQEYRSTNDEGAVEEIRALASWYPEQVTIHTGLDRAAFYMMLARSKVVVSTAHEENFGYAMVEAMAQKALPLMPVAASYPELARFHVPFLLDHRDDPVAKLHHLLSLQGAELEHEQAVALSCARRHDHAEEHILQAMLQTMLEG